MVPLAQLTRELKFILFLFAPISIVCGIWLVLVLVSLSLFTFLLLPVGLLIALRRGLCKNICTLGGGGSLCCLRRRLFDRQLVKLFCQRLYSGRVYGPNHAIGMGSRLRFLGLM